MASDDRALIDAFLRARNEPRPHTPPSEQGRRLDPAEAYHLQDRLREALLARGERLAGWKAAFTTRAAQEAKVAELAERALFLEKRAADREAAFDGYKERWAEAMSRLGLAPEAGVEEAAAVMSTLRDLFARVHSAQELERRIEGMHRDMRDFLHILEKKRVIGTLGEAATTSGRIVQEQEIAMVRQRIAALIEQKRG